MSKDKSKECKCDYHTGGCIHFMECQCYSGNPVRVRDCNHCQDTGYEPNDTGESAFDGDPCTVCRDSSEWAPPVFAIGALIPPELAWQEGKNAGEIATINTLLRAEAELKKCLFVFSDKRILADIDDLLKWLGVRKE